MNYAISIITPEITQEAPLALLEGTFETRLQKAAAYGYTGVELVICDPNLLDTDLIKDQLNRYGLKPAAVATGFVSAYRKLNLVSPDKNVRQQAKQLLAELIQFAGSVGAPVVTIGGFRGKSASVGSLEEAKTQLHDALSSADMLAAQSGVKVALEPIQIPESDLLNDAEEICAFIKEGGYCSVGLLLDIYHVLASEPNPMEAFRIHRDALIHIHLADTDRKALGLGSFDFTEFETVLKEIDYRGWQSVELPRGDDPDGNGRLFCIDSP